MRAKDKCPSCFQPISPTDFLCPHCELILDPSQAPERPAGDVSVVRRMLEAPQRGLPSSKPNPRPPRAAASEGMEGPTRKLDLGPELSGVPVVVATLAKKSGQLSEFEAWVVSLVDGLSDSMALAKKAGVRDFELRVVLKTLNEKQIIDFADEPLSDADLDMPSVMGTLDEDEPQAEAPPPPAPAPGANSERRDGRFVAPPTRAAVIPPMPENLPLAPARAPAIPPMPENLPLAPARAPAIPPMPENLPLAPPPVGGRPGRVEPPGLPPGVFAERAPPARPAQPPVLPYPGGSPEERRGLPPSRAVSAQAAAAAVPERPVERTDPRIAYTGQANRKVLDALKKVKRVDGSLAPPAAPKEVKEHLLADVLARDTLQVALRMEQGGRLDEAIRFLEKSISQSPDAPSLYNRLGIILMRERGDYRRAESLIRKACELAPDNTVYETNLQQVLTRYATRAQR